MMKIKHSHTKYTQIKWTMKINDIEQQQPQQTFEEG